ncbi:hypothetical protein DFP72DRAFT_1002949 [Ephemerocybe angulata]|uniref:Nephrocystin 3-like N-terminal domain-containing protein n=1 Tax=Ephemerocybe angulata TaxID=980116 RepID=A0A8H6IAZ1_9AGAR|nr:hypothetical protein DFP72DRAFT_1002949 [Tulosesus angulatus]
MLVEKTAPNALYNSSARFDPPKCDGGTRIEVTNEIMGWIQDRDAPTQLLCMTGAAGSGKSALQQTVSERCASLEILAASFFFNVGDSTRNNVSRIVPTIAYQLGQKNPSLRHLIGLAVEDDPLIFDTALKTQMEVLIVEPAHNFLAHNPSNSEAFPYVLLIDGLDECSGEARQRELLLAIQDCLLRGRTPFRVFLASRPEMAIHEALNDGGHLQDAAYHIRLSDDYDATADICRTVQRRLRELGLRRKLDGAWFSEADVNAIVAAASGQYVYATTVIRYIAEPRGSPIGRIRAVLGWIPGGGQKAKPFASLDLLYRNIILNAKTAFEETDEEERDFLLLLNCIIAIQGSPSVGFLLCHQDKLYSLDCGTCETIFCDLRSIIRVVEKGGRLELYHRSFLDFLVDEGRAGAIHVSKSRKTEYFTECCLNRIAHSSLDDMYHVDEFDVDFIGSCIQLLMDQYPATLPEDLQLEDSIANMFISFIQDGGLERMDAWFRFPDYEANGRLHDFVHDRREFINQWRDLYCSWLLPLFRKISPEQALVMEKYEGLWNAFWREHKDWHDDRCATCAPRDSSSDLSDG